MDSRDARAAAGVSDDCAHTHTHASVLAIQFQAIPTAKSISGSEWSFLEHTRGFVRLRDIEEGI